MPKRSSRRAAPRKRPRSSSRKKHARTPRPKAAVKATASKSRATTSSPARRLDWRPDLPDFRDFQFLEKVTAPVSLPASVDLRPLCSPVVNQGQVGSCTANALAGALEFLERMELKTPGKDPQEYGKAFSAVSRLFIYFNERTLLGHPGEDSGATLRVGMKSLLQWGACRESLWKYLASFVFKKPSPAAYREGEKHQISSYYSLETLNQVKQCLATGFPVVFGFAVYESFETPEVARSGIMPLPNADERLMGGHAVMAVGYDDSSRHLIVRNSWGPDWGQGGYFMMPYEIVDRLKLAEDFWTIRR